MLEGLRKAGAPLACLPLNFGSLWQIPIYFQLSDGEVPTWRGGGRKDCLLRRVGSVHEPRSRLPVVVLPEDIGLAVAVEIGSTLGMPAGWRGPNCVLERKCSPVHQPDGGLAVKRV